MDKKLKSSVRVIVLLALMEIVGLVFYDLQVHYLFLSFCFYLGAMFYITFLIQFKNNFQHLFDTTVLNKNITVIIVCFIIATVAGMLIELEFYLFPGNYSYNNTLLFIYDILNYTSRTFEVIIIIPFLLLAAKLKKLSPIDEVQKLAMTYYVIPLYYVGSIISIEYKLEILKYAALVFQLLVYFFTYKAYKKLGSHLK